MGFKKYRGPVETVEQAMMAHAVLAITCQVCCHYRRRYAFRLWQIKPSVHTLPLDRPVTGFWCSVCRRPAPVILSLASGL